MARSSMVIPSLITGGVLVGLVLSRSKTTTETKPSADPQVQAASDAIQKAVGLLQNATPEQRELAAQALEAQANQLAAANGSPEAISLLQKAAQTIRMGGTPSPEPKPMPQPKPVESTAQVGDQVLVDLAQVQLPAIPGVAIPATAGTALVTINSFFSIPGDVPRFDGHLDGYFVGPVSRLTLFPIPSPGVPVPGLPVSAITVVKPVF